MIDNGKSHSAKLENSPRLRRVLEFLRGRGYAGATTREIIEGAKVCAVNSAVDELRDNGYTIMCNQERIPGENSRVYRYVFIPVVPASTLLAAPGSAPSVQGQLFR